MDMINNMFTKKDSLINEYIKLMNRVRILNDLFGYAAYKWIQCNVGIADPIASSKTQVCKACVEFKPNDIHKGFDWKFDNYREPKFIIISYSTIKNEWGDRQDNEATLTFADFEKWI